MRFPFIGPSYTSLSVNVDAQRSLNLYPEIVESQTGKNRVVLYGTPGLTSPFCTLANAPVRGLWAGEDRLFAVGGSKLYEISSGGVATLLGDVTTDATNSPAQMFPNGTQLFVVSAGLTFLHNGVSLLAPNFSGGSTRVTARTGAFLDSYFIAAKPDSKQFYFSAPNDGTTWDPLEFSTKEGYPDNIASIIADHEELWLFGTHKSTEVWRNEGDATMAGGFRRDPGGFQHIACMAPWSVVNHDQGVSWLGGDTRGRPVAYRAQGFQPQRISTHAIEQAWAGYSSVSDCYAYAYTDHGHSFYVMNFMTGNATWVYDTTTGLWHERGYYNGSTVEKHRGRCHAFAFGKHLVGDHTTGAIYQMSSGTYTDNGTAIHRIRTAPHVAEENRRIAHHEFVLDLEVGSGAPNVTLDWSDDGAHTYSNTYTKAPSLSNYKGRCTWRRLGMARDRVYRVKITDSVRVALVDAYLRVSPSQS